MRLPDFLLFASDATIVGLWGAGLLMVAVIALIGEWRRTRRRNVDKVGFMPWTFIFIAASMLGSGLMVVAIKGWLAG